MSRALWQTRLTCLQVSLSRCRPNRSTATLSRHFSSHATNRIIAHDATQEITPILPQSSVGDIKKIFPAFYHHRLPNGHDPTLLHPSFRPVLSDGRGVSVQSKDSRTVTDLGILQLWSGSAIRALIVKWALTFDLNQDPERGLLKAHQGFNERALAANFKQDPERDLLKAHLSCSETRKEVFNERAHALLKRRGFCIEDVITWAWIFTASTPHKVLMRYLEVAEGRAEHCAPVPHFVLFQTLSVYALTGEDLRTFVRHLHQSYGGGVPATHADQADSEDATQPVDDAAESQETDTDDGRELMPFDAHGPQNEERVMELVYMLICHAREAAPDTFSDIVDLACNTMFRRKIQYGARMAGYCNEILRLLASPFSKHPFRLVHLQKKAQVRMLRKMFSSQPEVPLSRKGYRALISVQLAQAKTEEEAAWARAKTMSWPPWREDRLGIDQSLTYPGQNSRTTRLLRRMNEAGYEHRAWELAAGIYAGWDTDGTPTIQTRRHMPMPDNSPGFVFEDAVLNLDGSQTDLVSATEPLVWLARVDATRSTREAWAAFLSYRKAIAAAKAKPSHMVYEKMFEKLATPPYKPGFHRYSVPGDGIETWSDSNNPHDLVYVAREIPSVEAFYAEMKEDGIAPLASLLGTLVRAAPCREDIVTYVTDARIPISLKALMLGDGYETGGRETFDIKPLADADQRALELFVERCMAFPPLQKVRLPRASSTAFKDSYPVAWAMQLLGSVGVERSKIFRAALYGQRRRLEVSSMPFADKGATFRKLWAELLAVLERSSVYGISPDARTLRLVNEICCAILNRGPFPASQRCTQILIWIKSAFTRCTYGFDVPHEAWISADDVGCRQLIDAPTPYELRLLIETLAIFDDMDAIVDLIQWMYTNRHALEEQHRHILHAKHEMDIVRTVARIFAEGLLHEGGFIDICDGSRLSDEVAMFLPSRDECYTYLSERKGWQRRHTRYKRLRSAAGSRDWTRIPIEEGTDLG